MIPLNRFPRMMQEYVVKRVREQYRANHDRVMGLRTRDEALAYCDEVRRHIGRLFGPWPERTPLNVRITGERDHGAYRVRNVIFESRPGLLVTANIYFPVASGAAHPAVLCLCGHYWDAKANVDYQTFAQALARQGYIALIYDPAGQGERLLYPDAGGDSVFGPGPSGPSVREHNAADKGLALAGDWIGRWFAWDAIRALDVLLEQECVDPGRVGVTGNSGGGMMTAYAVACDPRLTMAAPSCWVSSWYHNVINEEPLDAEQCPPGALAAGMEQSDLLLARAPNQVILLTQEQDFFDQRGALEAFERIRHVYRLLGAEDKAAYYVGPGGHNYWQAAREAMYTCFNRHAGIDGPDREPAVTVAAAADLRCTPGGQTAGLAGAKSIPDLTVVRFRELAEGRGEPGGADLIRRVRAVLRLPERHGPPDYRILRPWSPRGLARAHAGYYVLETEPRYGAQVVVTKLEDECSHSRPLRGDGPAMLYLPHLSSDRELREDERLRGLEMAHPACFACDYRGIGESRPDTCRPDAFLDSYGSDYAYASHARMLGESYVAWRVHDVLSTLDWMASFGYDQVHLVARGWGTIPGALAALLDDRVRRVTLWGAPASFEAMVENPLHAWPFSAVLPGALEYFDLPDVYRELAATKNLEQCQPDDA